MKLVGEGSVINGAIPSSFFHLGEACCAVQLLEIRPATKAAFALPAKNKALLCSS